MTPPAEPPACFVVDLLSVCEKPVLRLPGDRLRDFADASVAGRILAHVLGFADLLRLPRAGLAAPVDHRDARALPGGERHAMEQMPRA